MPKLKVLPNIILPIHGSRGSVEIVGEGKFYKKEIRTKVYIGLALDYQKRKFICGYIHDNGSFILL